VRPQALGLSEHGQGTEGLVHDMGFLGDQTRCLVPFNGLDKPVVTLLAGSDPQNGELAVFYVLITITFWPLQRRVPIACDGVWHLLRQHAVSAILVYQ
jgi:hypothetical protein